MVLIKISFLYNLEMWNQGERARDTLMAIQYAFHLSWNIIFLTPELDILKCISNVLAERKLYFPCYVRRERVNILLQLHRNWNNYFAQQLMCVFTKCIHHCRVPNETCVRHKYLEQTFTQIFIKIIVKIYLINNK